MSVPSPIAPARRSRAGSLLLVLLVLLALGAGGWYAWTQWQARQDRLLALAEQQRSALDAHLKAIHNASAAESRSAEVLSALVAGMPVVAADVVGDDEPDRL